MEKTPNNVGQKSSEIPHIHIGEATKQAVDIILKRKKGQLMGLKTCWKKLNRYIGGGIQSGTQYIVAGRSGVGKSAFVNLLIKSLFDFNRNEKVVILYFNFEMPSYKQVIRKMSKELEMSVNQIMSSESPISDIDYDRVTKLEGALSKYEIYFVDIPINVVQINTKVMEFSNRFKGYHLVNVFDHSRLVTDSNERDEMAKIGRLSKVCMYLKKKINCSNIIVSQLNRNIESPERAKMGYEPMASDIFGADSLYQDADVVLVPHRPEMYRLDIYNGFATKDLIALHILDYMEYLSYLCKMKGIYKITNLVNNKIYIGSTNLINNRFAKHKSHLRTNTHSNRHLQAAWNKYGSENFKFEVIEKLTDTDQLDIREQHYLDLYKAYDRTIGYNKRIIASSNRGRIVDAQGRANMSKGQKGKKQTVDSILKRV
jgi:replicative DNA helicase